MEYQVCRNTNHSVTTTVIMASPTSGRLKGTTGLHTVRENRVTVFKHLNHSISWLFQPIDEQWMLLR